MQAILKKIANKDYLKKLLFEDFTHYVTRIAGILLLVLMFFTFVDVVARYLFSLPIKGSAEITEITQTIFIIAGTFVITLFAGHIEVEILESFFPEKFKKWRDIAFNILFAVCLYFVGVRVLQIAQRTVRRNEITEYWHFQNGYLQYYVAIMLFITLIFIVLKLIFNLLDAFSQSEEKS